MKTIRIIHRMAAAGLGALLLLAACDHKELCYQHPHTSSLQVVFDWREAPMRTRKACTYGSSPRRAENRCNTTLPARRRSRLAGRRPLRRTGPERRHGKDPVRRYETAGRIHGRRNLGSLLASMGRGGDQCAAGRRHGGSGRAAAARHGLRRMPARSDGPPGNRSDHYALPERKGLPATRSKSCM